VARYTVLSEQQIVGVLRQYGWQDAHVVALAGGAANSSYEVRAGAARYVLTLLDNHDPATAQRLAALLRYLAGFAVPTSRLVPTVDGADVGVFEHLPVLAKEYIPGQSIVPLPEAAYAPAGRLLAAVHQVPAPGWLADRNRRLPAQARSRMAEFPDRGFADWMLEQLDATEPRLRVDAPRGLVHGDYFADNLVIDPAGGLHVIDWETAAIDLLCIDIGMALVGLCGYQGTFSPERATAFLAGYAATRPIDPVELDALPAAATYATIMIGYFRYVRHHLARPDPARQHLYREMVDLARSIETTWSRIRPILENRDMA
jgi:homoserine kinase type II